MGVSGRVAVVAGSGSGMGRAVALGLARDGAHVAAFDMNAEAANETIEQIGPTAHAVGTAHGLDLTDSSAVHAAVGQVVDRFGAVDILVNCAGVITGPTDVDVMSEHDWDWVIETNVKSQFLTARACVPHMKSGGFGRILNFGSRSWLGVGGRANYSASKGAVVSLTRSLAIELGPYGITANCISPTLVITPLFEATPKSDQDSVMKRVMAQPIARPGTTDDILHAVRFFVDDAASYVTGQNIYVGGGADLVYSVP